MVTSLYLVHLNMNLRLALCKDPGSALVLSLGMVSCQDPFWVTSGSSLWFLHLLPHFHLSLFLSALILHCYGPDSPYLYLPSALSSPTPNGGLPLHPSFLLSCNPLRADLPQSRPTLQIRFFPFSPAPPWSRPYKPHPFPQREASPLSPALVQAFLLLEAALAALPHPSRHTSAPAAYLPGTSLTGQLSTARWRCQLARVKRHHVVFAVVTIAGLSRGCRPSCLSQRSPRRCPGPGDREAEIRGWEEMTIHSRQNLPVTTTGPPCCI